MSVAERGVGHITQLSNREIAKVVAEETGLPLDKITVIKPQGPDYGIWQIESRGNNNDGSFSVCFLATPHRVVFGITEISSDTPEKLVGQLENIALACGANAISAASQLGRESFWKKLRYQDDGSHSFFVKEL